MSRSAATNSDACVLQLVCSAMARGRGVSRGHQEAHEVAPDLLGDVHARDLPCGRDGGPAAHARVERAGEVHAVVYRDLNDNGVRDPSEPFEKGALVTTGTIQSDRPTDGNGSVIVGGLTAFKPVAVGIDLSSLSDPMLVPKKALQVVVPRPGVPAEVQIGLVGGGDVEGALVKSGGLGFEGVDLELVDAGGKVVSTSRTDYDGFFLFERVAYGNYAVRVAQTSAAAAKIAIDLGLHLSVTPEKSVVRVGTIRPVAQAQIAQAAAGAAPSSSLR